MQAIAYDSNGNAHWPVGIGAEDTTYTESVNILQNVVGGPARVELEFWDVDANVIRDREVLRRP
ncbi:hypothetical protein AB5J62_14995 [Amycolatopsis sp. cg5]|uniref:hypothetical protein n=1 Tax=Amycolatopsis sp. cg5 TaxID=3238802 RepID=UPI0035256434